MKKLLYLTPIFAILLVFASCSKAPEGKKAVTTAAKGEAAMASEMATTYNISGNSSVTWTGSKVGGKHMGKFNISKGMLKVNKGNIEAGSFTIDMASNQVTDLKAGEGKEKLERHLSTGDFFDIANYPSGTFTITGVKPVSGNAKVTHDITGDLKLKDKTHSITFGANVNVGPNAMSAVTPSFKINRTNWGINYGSGIINTAKDKIINDEVAIVINLAAKK